jgi:serine protease Do
MNRTRTLVFAVCVVTVPTSGVCQQAPAGLAVGGDHRVVSRVPPDMLGQLSQSLQLLAAKVSPAVVQITVTRWGPAEEGDRTNQVLIVRQHAMGAGVIVDPDGYIMTNAHVVAGARRIRVMLSLPATAADHGSSAGGVRVLDATVIGSESRADLALLKIDATNLPALRFILDRAPQPGELVFAIGSPIGLRNSVTMGVISSAWRQPDPDNPMVYLQTDAPINPGNSGGPLVDVTGAIVGLNTFVMNSGAGVEGLGFAIPARIVDFVYQSLRKYGRVDHAEIGVVAQTITPAMAKGLGLAQDWGVVIADVIPHGPADRAGLRPADIIVAVDGHPMLGLHEFTASLYLHPPQQVLQVDALRGTERLSFQVSALRAHDSYEYATAPDPMKSHIEPLGILGLDVDARLRALLPHVRMDTGVMVLGRARGFDSVDAGLRVGDVIHSLNGASIESVAQLRSAVARLKSGDSVVLQIERLGQFQYLALEID